MVLQTSNFDNVTGIICKNIKFNTIHAFEEYKKEVWLFCNKVKTDQKYEQMMGYEGFGAAPEISEGADISVVDFAEGYKTTIAQKQFAYEVRISWMQRNMAVKSANFTKQIGYFLGRSANIRYEYVGADVLNNGFTDSAAYHGGDGKPLFSASHAWKSTGVTYSNLLTAADASRTSIMNGLKTVHSAKMEQNIPCKISVNRIVFGNDNVFVIPEILKSTLDPESGNNRHNALSDEKMTPILLHYTTDSDAWFLMTPDSKISIFEHTAPFLNTEMYPNHDIGENIYMSFNSGFEDPLTVYGNAGS